MTALGTRTLRVGTRRSALARAQSMTVADLLAGLGRRPELVEVTTEGDRTTEPITSYGGVGVFVTALRDRLLADENVRVDVAVHSYKDLPTEPHPALVVAAVPPREDPRDVVVTRDGRPLAELSPGATVGTGSPRRAAQLALLGLPITVVPVRGNVDTRIAHVEKGDIDAVVVARAGVARLGRLEVVAEVLDDDRMLPAPAQGALAVECRAGDSPGDRAILDLVATLDDPDSRAAVTAERAVLAELRAGCTAPVGAHARITRGADGTPVLTLDAVVAGQPAHGGVVPVPPPATVRMSATGSPDAPEELGRRLAGLLLDAGAAALLGERQ